MTIDRKRKVGRKIICVEINKEFETIQEASDELNINRRNINACCLEKRKTAGRLSLAI